MRILFMGTPEFAAASLAALYAGGYDVCGVFTKPDKPSGRRGMKLVFSPVKELALRHGTPLFQPAKMRDGTALETVKSLSPDLIAVVAYGRILPPDILSVPERGCINIHGSLLPKYRGAAPIQRAVLGGETVTGVTAMYLAEEMDAGDIISMVKTEIGETETSGQLTERLMAMGASLLCRTVDDIAAGKVQRTPQDASEAPFAPPIQLEEAPIVWTRFRREILNQIRGLQPWPVATAELGGTLFKIYRAEGCGTEISGKPGEVLSAGKEGITVACGDGTIRITELQAPGGKRMAAGDYLRGHDLCL